MSERNAVQQAFDRFGKDAGLEKKSGSWYRRGDEVISISNLQKSQYGPQYYFNQGFWLRQLGDERYPKSNQAHIVTRVEDLLPEAEQRIGELLDLDCEMPDEQRIEELLALLNQRLVPLIERGDSIAGLRSMVDDGTFAGAGIRGPAQEALGILAG
jgi:hypothetical protein